MVSEISTLEVEWPRFKFWEDEDGLEGVEERA